MAISGTGGVGSTSKTSRAAGHCDDCSSYCPILSSFRHFVLSSFSYSMNDAIESLLSHLAEDYAVYMVFPYMDHDLVGLLDAPGVRFSPPQIKCYIKQLLEGMAYLHKNKILHRDMKSANILMNNRGELKIADFGLARPAMEHRHGYYTGGVVTRWYRPPELLLGATRYGRSIDMWGVG